VPHSRPLSLLASIVVSILLAAAVGMFGHPPAPGAASSRAVSAPSTADRVRGLSVVWTDTRAGQGVEVWTLALDGSPARLVTTLPSGFTPLALGDHFLALGDADSLVVLDLITGARRDVSTGQVVRSALFVDGALVYATHVGCGPETADGFQVAQLDLANGAVRPITRIIAPGMELLGFTAATRELIVLPRGCDVGLAQIQTMNTDSGAITGTVAVEGCGWVRVTPDGGQALVSWMFCAERSSEAPLDGRVYNLHSGDARPFGVRDGAPTGTPFVIAPDSGRAALAVSVVRGTGSGARRSGGVWLMRLDDLTMTELWPDGGAEAIPVAWSPDGGALLAGSVLAQGVCAYAVVDVATGAVTPLPEMLTVCGVNGAVVGWTALG
jgi:hypothetical protein